MGFPSPRYPRDDRGTNPYDAGARPIIYNNFLFAVEFLMLSRYSSQKFVTLLRYCKSITPSCMRCLCQSRTLLTHQGLAYASWAFAFLIIVPENWDMEPQHHRVDDFAWNIRGRFTEALV